MSLKLIGVVSRQFLGESIHLGSSWLEWLRASEQLASELSASKGGESIPKTAQVLLSRPPISIVFALKTDEHLFRDKDGGAMLQQLEKVMSSKF